MSRAYVRQRSGGMWVIRRDLETMTRAKTGYVLMPDLEWVDAEHIVLEVDTDKLTSRPVGLIAKPEGIKHVAKYLDSERALAKNRAIRLRDLVTLIQIAYKSGRHKNTVSDLKRAHPELWPRPIATWGPVKVYYWPDVAEFFQKLGLKVRLEGHKKRHRQMEVG